MPERQPGLALVAGGDALPPRVDHEALEPNEDGCQDLIVARAIPFPSLCMHHLLPFRGFAHVGYLPGERLMPLEQLVPLESA